MSKQFILGLLKEVPLIKHHQVALLLRGFTLTESKIAGRPVLEIRKNGKRIFVDTPDSTLRVCETIEINNPVILHWNRTVQ